MALKATRRSQRALLTGAVAHAEPQGNAMDTGNILCRVVQRPVVKTLDTVAKEAACALSIRTTPKTTTGEGAGAHAHTQGGHPKTGNTKTLLGCEARVPRLQETASLKMPATMA